MVIFFTAILFSTIPFFNKKIFTNIEYGFYITLLLIGTINITNIYQNYKISNKIQNENIQIIEDYKRNSTNNNIELYKLKDEKYGWSMPYNSLYHENWFKIYYGIKDLTITWIDYNK